jgi:NADH oxidase (H2O2-forming)
MSLPNYYPGGEPINIKLVVNEETGKIIGAQAVGSNAALRINTFACAILNDMNVEDLKKLETAYAPPIAPTLDAITLVCDVVSLKMGRRRR